MARRPGLGKGLEALIPGNEEKSRKQPAHTSQGIIHIPIDQIIANPQQPRTQIDADSLRELAESINQHGIIQPLIVSGHQDQEVYTLIAGERRWRAAKLVGLTMVPVIEKTVSEQGQLEIALIENLQRADLTPLEMAEAYRQLSENFSLTHEQIAERVGKSRTSISNTLRLLKLSDQAKKALAEDLITEGHARAILGLSSIQAQQAVLNTVVNLDLNVRQTEALVKKMSGERPPSKPKKEPSPEVRDIENRLRNYFGTKVAIHESSKGGSLVIHYYSAEEFDTILNKILAD